MGSQLRDGFLVCACDRYPVVAGIPVLRKDDSRRLDAVRADLDRERADLAFLRLLAPRPSPHQQVEGAAAAPRRAWRSLRRLAGARALRRRLAEATADGTGGIASTASLLDLYFAADRTTADELRCRWSAPRHLVALALSTLFAGRPGRVLDVGSGCGHLLFALHGLDGGLAPIGVDDSYFCTWLARHRLAPTAETVCARIDGRLPFRDGSFAALIRDGEHGGADAPPRGCRDLLRLVDGGPVVLTGLRASQRLGSRTLVDVHHRELADDETLDRYVAGEGPDLRRCAHEGAMADGATLSLVLSRSPEVFHAAAPIAPPPLHARGVPRLNPRFVARYERDGVTAVRTLPAAAPAEENRRLCRYLPASAALEPEATAALQARRWTKALYALAERYVVLGMPASA